MNSDQEMLYSIALKLRPVQEGSIPATVGRQAYAAFLATVRQADKALAEVLHEAPVSPKPFTVSPLLGVPRALEGWVAITPGKDYYLRFTVLLPDIFQQFMRRFLRAETRPTLRLGRVEFLISEVLTTPGSSPWAGYTSFGQLWEKAEAMEDIRLEFTSPTAFNLGTRDWGKHFVVLPEPTLVFRSLLKAWNAYAPMTFAEEPLREYVAENVVVKRHDIRTQMLRYPRHFQVGFIGTVTYGLMADDPSTSSGQRQEIRRQLNALADFAFYAGVGYHTTMGMGQTRRVPGG